MSRTFRRLVAVLILALLAGAGAAQALPAAKARVGPDPTRFEDPLTRAWSWVIAVVGKVGSFIDPNGNSLNPEPGTPVAPTGDTTASDVGSFIDPNGNS